MSRGRRAVAGNLKGVDAAPEPGSADQQCVHRGGIAALRTAAQKSSSENFSAIAQMLQVFAVAFCDTRPKDRSTLRPIVASYSTGA